MMTPTTPRARPALRVVGDTIDDRTAEFFVARATAQLDVAYTTQRHHAMERLARAGDGLFNKLARERFAKRMAAGLGETGVFLSVRGDKRTARVSVGELAVVDGRPTVVLIWLRLHRGREGAGDAFDLLTFSRHALVRCVQRAGVRDVPSAGRLIRHLAQCVSAIAAIATTRTATTPGDLGWLLPVELPDGGEIVLLVKKPHADSVATVVTVLKPEMVSGPAMDAGRRLVAAAASDCVDNAVELFAAALV